MVAMENFHYYYYY